MTEVFVFHIIYTLKHLHLTWTLNLKLWFERWLLCLFLIDFCFRFYLFWFFYFYFYFFCATLTVKYLSTSSFISVINLILIIKTLEQNVLETKITPTQFLFYYLLLFRVRIKIEDLRGLICFLSHSKYQTTTKPQIQSKYVNFSPWSKADYSKWIIC